MYCVLSESFGLIKEHETLSIMETREIFDLVAVSIILIAAMAPICGYILDKSWDNAPGKNREMNSEH